MMKFKRLQNTMGVITNGKPAAGYTGDWADYNACILCNVSNLVSHIYHICCSVHMSDHSVKQINYFQLYTYS